LETHARRVIVFAAGGWCDASHQADRGSSHQHRHLRGDAVHTSGHRILAARVVFLAVVVIAATLATLAIPEELLNERYKPGIQKSQPLADKIILVAFISSFVATIVLIPLDLFRFHLVSPPPPMIISILGLVLFAAGWWLIARAMIENAFAAPVVKLQKERGQHVIDSGPYRIVRHPMYSSVIPLLAGMALWFGSYAAAIASIVPTVLIAIRILFEERFLRRELPGYEEYTTRTRFRLVPFVW
jgi:protein-S-isoprenylcysteine O-methyltransferase Ste14